MSIKRLKSRGQPPWGCMLVGYTTVNSAVAGVDAALRNLVVRFFTPDTQTEVGKTTIPAIPVIVHIANDTTNVVTSAAATDQTTLNTLLNEIKADYNAHRVDTTFHTNADTTNAVTSADASNEATSVTLSNEIKADYNAHRSQATIHPYNEVRNVTTSADSIDLATAIVLANEIKGDYNLHRLYQVKTFIIYGITPGTYDVGIKAANTLSCLAQDVVFAAGTPVTVDFGLSYIGDTQGDDAINASDATVAGLNATHYGGCLGYAGNWSMPDPNTFGDWTVIPTARRKMY